VVCKRYPSTIADHKEDHRGNTAKFFDPANVRGVCKGCHDAKTGSQHGKGDRTPPKQGLQDGKVLDHGTQVDDDNSIPDFDFTKKPIEPKEE
jgi:5-methylcytosine-specific restriction endonuclease McrA